jgi:hypothetical protein
LSLCIDFIEIVESGDNVDYRIPPLQLLVVGVGKENGRRDLDGLIEKRRQDRAWKVDVQ